MEDQVSGLITGITLKVFIFLFFNSIVFNEVKMKILADNKNS